ncbi:hypothetical protein MTO96_005526 [Rhipicephalus appendiculatus]
MPGVLRGGKQVVAPLLHDTLWGTCCVDDGSDRWLSGSFGYTVASRLMGFGGPAFRFSALPFAPLCCSLPRNPATNIPYLLRLLNCGSHSFYYCSLVSVHWRGWFALDALQRTSLPSLPSVTEWPIFVFFSFLRL